VSPDRGKETTFKLMRLAVSCSCPSHKILKFGCFRQPPSRKGSTGDWAATTGLLLQVNGNYAVKQANVSPSYSISSGAQYVTLQKIFFTSKSLVMYSFANPPIKLKLAHQIGAGTTNSKPLGPITNQIEHIYYTLFYRVHTPAAPFTSHRKPMQLYSAKTNFPEPNRQILDLLHPILLFRITY